MISCPASRCEGKHGVLMLAEVRLCTQPPQPPSVALPCSVRISSCDVTSMTSSLLDLDKMSNVIIDVMLRDRDVMLRDRDVCVCLIVFVVSV